MLPLKAKASLINTLLGDAISSASKNDVPLLADLIASQEKNQLALEDKVRQLKFSRKVISSSTGRPSFQTWIMEDDAPWKGCVPRLMDMPGMISDEEIQYYDYIGSLYEGRGEVVELGPWLGRSTRHIIQGLSENRNFIGKKLHVFDDFVWRPDWMDPYVSDSERLSKHADFRFLFDRYVREVSADLDVTRGKITDYDGNEFLPKIKWDQHCPVEMMYIDCGRTMQVNQGWFEIFSPSFVKDVTLLIMQDWRLHRERPRRSYNQTNYFTDAHPELELVHEVQTGGLAAFLYKGNG
jgi:hypothetical protein